MLAFDARLMDEYQIHFYRGLEKGEHVFRCKAESLQVAWLHFGASFPDGLAFFSCNPWAETKSPIHYYEEKVEETPPRKPNFRERMEANKEKRKNLH